MSSNEKAIFLIVTLFFVALFHSPLYAQPTCKTESIPKLPDVDITSVVMEPQPVPHCKVSGVIGPIEQELIEPSYLEMCDELDGIKDGILNDPRDCKFDVASLLCKGAKTDSYLSSDQLAAVKTVYEGPKDAQGNKLDSGFAFGGENSARGWPRWLTGGLKFQTDLDEFQDGIDVGDNAAPVAPSTHFAFGNGVMKYFVYNDPDWSYKNYSFENFQKDVELAASTLNANNPDLSAFRKRGGKLLMFTGWSDSAITPLGTIAYYEDVLAHDKTAADDTCLFMMPGVEHCAGGPGPSFTNYLDEIDKWVVSGKAPEQAPAYWLDEKFKPNGSRLLCAYPKVAKYDGKGDTRDA